MIKELKYIILEYTEDDLEYIDYISDYIDEHIEEILVFFDNLKMDKITVRLYDSLERLKEHYKSICKRDKAPEWLSGFAANNSVYTLSLKELHKSKGHENRTTEDLAKLILHEYAHVCYYTYNGDQEDGYIWLTEGISCGLSHQYDNVECEITDSLDNIIKGNCRYNNYYCMFDYLYKNYSNEYILELVKNPKLLNDSTPRIYNEATKQKKHL